MRAPISQNLVPELRRVASQYIALPGKVHFTFPMHDTASTYLGKVHVNIIILLPRVVCMVCYHLV